MKKLIVFILIGINLCFITVFGNGNYNLTAKDPLVEKDFEINKIFVGMLLSKVPEILGKPEKVTSNNKKAINYYYNQMLIKSFYFEGENERTVDYILTKSKKHSTYRGIKIGSTRRDVIARYGKPIIHDDKLYYQTSIGVLTYYAIDFLIEKDKVKQIEIYMPVD